MDFTGAGGAWTVLRMTTPVRLPLPSGTRTRIPFSGRASNSSGTLYVRQPFAGIEGVSATSTRGRPGRTGSFAGMAPAVSLDSGSVPILMGVNVFTGCHLLRAPEYPTGSQKPSGELIFNAFWSMAWGLQHPSSAPSFCTRRDPAHVFVGRVSSRSVPGRPGSHRQMGCGAVVNISSPPSSDGVPRAIGVFEHRQALGFGSVVGEAPLCAVDSGRTGNAYSNTVCCGGGPMAGRPAR